jgi:RNA polymerase sigma-70 factor, ECF subfamily
MEWTDSELVARARTGESDAFRLLVERHSRPLFRLAYRMTGNRQDAEDTVQEAFLRAFRQLHRFDDRASFGTWLYRIAMNCSLDFVRSRQRRKELAPTEDSPLANPVLSVPAPDPGPDRLALSTEVRDRLAEAMTELSASERTAFVLRHFEGMCIDDLSRVLGCQPGAAKHSVFRAVQKLRRALEPLVSTAR